jgi:hypothetical protein
MKLLKFLAIVAAVAVSTGLQAAKITHEVQVPGYSRAGWVKIVPELRGALRGGVVYLPQYGGWVADRVAIFELTRRGNRQSVRRCQSSTVDNRVWMRGRAIFLRQPLEPKTIPL